MKRLLFISHDASRTGAPMIVLFLLEWFKKKHDNVIIDTVLINGGSLETDFERLSHKVFNYKSIRKTNKKSFIKSVFNKLRIKTSKTSFYDKMNENKYDVIYANSVVSVQLANEIKKYTPQSKLIVHIHELENVIKTRVPKFKLYIKNIDKFIVPSNVVKDNLVANYEVASNKIVKIHEFSKLKESEAELIKDDVFRVGACGTISLRKGFDIFIQVAKSVKKKHPDFKIEFIWIGSNAELMELAKSDIKKLGLENTVHFIGEQTDLMKYFKMFDVFLLTSREDPFPLVCIDVAALSKPIICFNKDVGTAEVLVNGGGHVVDYLNIDEMGEKIINYYNNPNDLINDGKIAKELFSMFTPENLCPIIFDEMKKTYENIV